MDLFVQAVAPWSGAAHDVPLHIAAAPEGRQQPVVDRTNRPLEIPLEHPVELKVLTRRDPERAVPPLLGDAVVGEIRIGTEDAAGNASADHHHVVLVEPEAARLPAAIAIVLLIHPMKFQQHAGVVAEHRRILEQLVADRAPKAVAPRLDSLRRRHLVEVDAASARVAHGQTATVDRGGAGGNIGWGMDSVLGSVLTRAAARVWADSLCLPRSRRDGVRHRPVPQREGLAATD